MNRLKIKEKIEELSRTKHSTAAEQGTISPFLLSKNVQAAHRYEEKKQHAVTCNYILYSLTVHILSVYLIFKKGCFKSEERKWKHNFPATSEVSFAKNDIPPFCYRV